MNKLLNTIIRASISATMTDREAFTERVAKIIEDKVGNDPDAAARMGEKLAAVLESVNENLLIEQLLRPDKDDSELEKKIDKLTQAIQQLNDNLTQKSDAK